MPRVIVTTNLPPRGEPRILLDEHLSTVHLSSDHAANQLVERLTWAIRDAERAELDRLARPLLEQQANARTRTRRGPRTRAAAGSRPAATAAAA